MAIQKQIYKVLVAHLTEIRNHYQHNLNTNRPSNQNFVRRLLSPLLLTKHFDAMRCYLASYFAFEKEINFQFRTQELYDSLCNDVPYALYPVSLPGGCQALCWLQSEVGRAMFYGGGFESKELLFTHFFLKPGGIFIDVGANIGLFSVVAAKKVGPSGYVYAFEPDDSQRALYLYNMLLNEINNYTVFDYAVSNKIGEDDFVISADGALSSFRETNHIAQKRQLVKNVKVITLNYFKNMYALSKVDFIKIDVEGAEGEVLAGGYEFLTSDVPPVIMCEFCDDTLSVFDMTGNKLYKFLQSYSYQLLGFHQDNWYQRFLQIPSLVPVEAQAHYVYDNLVAFKPY